MRQQFDKRQNVSAEKVYAVSGAGRSIQRGEYSTKVCLDRSTWFRGSAQSVYIRIGNDLCPGELLAYYDGEGWPGTPDA